MAKKYRNCIVCNKLLENRRRKFCCDACREEYERRNTIPDRCYEEYDRARQKAGTLDYDENDPYDDADEDSIYCDGRRVGREIKWKRSKG